MCVREREIEYRFGCERLDRTGDRRECQGFPFLLAERERERERGREFTRRVS